MASVKPSQMKEQLKPVRNIDSVCAYTERISTGSQPQGAFECHGKPAKTLFPGNPSDSAFGRGTGWPL
jgi:hypothetical protein